MIIYSNVTVIIVGKGSSRASNLQSVEDVLQQWFQKWNISDIFCPLTITKEHVSKDNTAWHTLINRSRAFDPFAGRCRRSAGGSIRRVGEWKSHPKWQISAESSCAWRLSSMVVCLWAFCLYDIYHIISYLYLHCKLCFTPEWILKGNIHPHSWQTHVLCLTAQETYVFGLLDCGECPISWSSYGEVLLLHPTEEMKM